MIAIHENSPPTVVGRPSNPVERSESRLRVLNCESGSCIDSRYRHRRILSTAFGLPKQLEILSGGFAWGWIDVRLGSMSRTLLELSVVVHETLLLIMPSAWFGIPDRENS